MKPENILTDRQQQLFEWLQIQSSVSVLEIEDHFGISSPTAYRDIRVLVQSGRAIKMNYGIKLASIEEPGQPVGKCTFCGGTIHQRVSFVILKVDGSHQSACCPHCGLMALDTPDVQSALASDYLYGRMVNARQATFLLNSSVFICCEPSVLCFADVKKARCFQAGFGGEICSLDQAKARVKEIMTLNKSN